MPIKQQSKIKVRHALQQNLPLLDTGELGWAIDTQKLYIGNGTVEEGAPFMGNTELSGGAGNIPTFFSEIPPTGVAPTTTYVLSYSPSFVFGIFKNGQLMYPGVSYDYTILGNTITFNYTTVHGDVVFAVYAY